MNFKDYMNGNDIVDINANYSVDVANIKRQLNATVEKDFNESAILSDFNRGKEILSLHGEEIYIHDLSKALILPYCYSYPLLSLVTDGIKFSDFTSKPAKRLDTFISHLREFASHVAVRTRGACGFPDLFVCMAHYVKKEDLFSTPEKTKFLENKIQSFFYSLNENLREGSEAMFSNVNFFDKYFLEDLFSESYFPILDIDIEDVIEFQNFVMDWHTNEVTKTKMLRFPVITTTLLKDKNNMVIDKEFYKRVCENNSKHTMYNILALENTGSIASCCRLINDMNTPFLNSLGSGGLQIGSIGVASLNLPHIYLKYGKDKFFDRVKYLCDIIMEFHDWHRSFLKRVEDIDSLVQSGLRVYDRMFSTFGIIGFWDLKEVGNFSWDEMETFAKNLNEYIKSYNKFTNIEIVPAESACVTLFDNDKKIFNNDYYKKTSMYSNQIVSPWINLSIPEIAMKTGKIAKYMTGGSMTFIPVMSNFENPEQMETIMNGVIQSGVPYFAFDTDLSECEDEHLMTMRVDSCPVCGKDIEKHFRRVVGYFVNTKSMRERVVRDLKLR